jgi:hypothetical protein
MSRGNENDKRAAAERERGRGRVRVRESNLNKYYLVSLMLQLECLTRVYP